MRISVIVPVRNSAAHLPDLSRRLMNLEGSVCEIIIVDDGSTDNTPSLVTQLAVEEPRVKVINLPQGGGVANARNRALRQATGEWIWFVDSDDTWPDNAPSTLLMAATEVGADIAIGRAERVSPTGSRTVVDGSPTKQLLQGPESVDQMLGGSIHGFLWNKIFRRAALGEDPFPLLRSQSDFVGCLRAFSAAKTVALTPEVVYHYTWNPNSITRRASATEDTLTACLQAASEAVSSRPPADAARKLAAFKAWFVVVDLAMGAARTSESWRLTYSKGQRARELAKLRYVPELRGELPAGKLLPYVCTAALGGTYSCLLKLGHSSVAFFSRLGGKTACSHI